MSLRTPLVAIPTCYREYNDRLMYTTVVRYPHAVVDAVERLIRSIRKFCRAFRTHGLNLRIREVRGGARHGKSQAGKENRESAGIAVKKAREGKESLRNEICAAKCRDVTSKPQTKVIVKEAPACAENSSWRDRPGKSKPRREICLIGEAAVIVPAETEIQSYVSEDLPVVLDEGAGVVVA